MTRGATLIALMVLGSALGACASTASDDRGAAGQAALAVLDREFAASDNRAVAACVTNNATAAEITALAKAQRSTITTQTTETVLQIAKRRYALACIVQSGFSGFGA